jgi:hypothetical protein
MMTDPEKVILPPIATAELCARLGWMAGYESARRGADGKCFNEAFAEMDIVQLLSASQAPAGDLVERVARTIAEGLGDNFDHAFVNKPEWTAARGEKGGRYRDINEPMQPDYMDAARSVIAAMQPGWRDMGSAPKDGTLIMVGAPGCGVSNVRWMLDTWIDEQGFTQGEWPTHWQPLPAPPGVGG